MMRLPSVSSQARFLTFVRNDTFAHFERGRGRRAQAPASPSLTTIADSVSFRSEARNLIGIYQKLLFLLKTINVIIFSAISGSVHVIQHALLAFSPDKEVPRSHYHRFRVIPSSCSSFCILCSIPFKL